MFLIYINDLVALLAQYGVNIKLFADDVKLYVKIVNRSTVINFTRHYLPCMYGLLTGSWEFLLISVVLCISARVKLLISFNLVAFNFLLCLHVAIWVLQSEMTFHLVIILLI